MNISPELIPHSEFHAGIWLQSVKHPGWYYFKKQKNTNTITNHFFSESVDEPLRDLVDFLHTNNIKTTPSCSGHHISDRDLSKIYTSLENDAGEIKGNGLQLKNIESGNIILFKDPDYNLPWSRHEFINKLEVYQQKGVLGIKLGQRKNLRNELLKLNIDSVRVDERDGITFLFTNEHAYRPVKKLWEEITTEIKQAFEKHPVKHVYAA